ncbi:hypothetical protein [Paenibacillus sp. Soil724D2]|uniref:hypothetical protein n=1 Tax=Paenibacillus sp. (strain Soil724D2) TaxID=1736392 RepID=UPI000713F778|nr:hypothetical protein [Paenibacillus sp. Soil724D2]KRE38777.1 hypothetical protein ASG85_35390 [Paenibacillus sp. Soil724D2]
MRHSTPMEHLLENLRETTGQISHLDLNEEANESLLLSLQNEQVELRQKIEETLLDERRSFTEHERQYLRACLVMEQNNIERFKTTQQSLVGQLQRINSGKVSRELYHYEEEQNVGFFIDKNR